MYHRSERYKRTLFTIVCGINAGRSCVGDEEGCNSATAVHGESLLVGLMKPDGGTRPIGIGSAMRRLAGRVLMWDLAVRMGEVLTESAPDPERLQRAVEERRKEARQAAANVGKSAEAAKAAGDAAAEQLRVAQAKCNKPLQLGCGVAGGTFGL